MSFFCIYIHMSRRSANLMEKWSRVEVMDRSNVKTETLIFSNLARKITTELRRKI